jgi:hypothetical protein
MWDRYQRGERRPSRSGSIRRRVRRHSTKSRASIAPTALKQTVDRYINEFERLLDEVSRDERGPAALRGHLVSETGLVYTLLAHAAGRWGKADTIRQQLEKRRLAPPLFDGAGQHN